ncbi:MAG: hypothetical protein ACKO50_11705 [Cyanobium sp.]
MLFRVPNLLLPGPVSRRLLFGTALITDTGRPQDRAAGSPGQSTPSGVAGDRASGGSHHGPPGGATGDSGALNRHLGRLGWR